MNIGRVTVSLKGTVIDRRYIFYILSKVGWTTFAEFYQQKNAMFDN